MSEHAIRVTTTADTRGLQEISRYLDEINDKAKAISGNLGTIGVGNPADSGVTNGANALARHQQALNTFATNAKARHGRHQATPPPYDLMTTTGLEDYYQSVYTQAAPVLSLLRGNANADNPSHTPRKRQVIRGGVENSQGIAPLSGTHFKSKNLTWSQQDVEDQFNRAGLSDVQQLQKQVWNIENPSFAPHKQPTSRNNAQKAPNAPSFFGHDHKPWFQQPQPKQPRQELFQQHQQQVQRINNPSSLSQTHQTSQQVGNPPTTQRSSQTARSGMQNVPGMVPVLGSHFKTKNIPGSQQYYEDWFNRVGAPDIQSLLSQDLKQAYQEAQDLFVSGRTITPSEFYQNYASEANQNALPQNQPTPKKSVLSVGNLTNHFFKNAQGGSLGSVLGSGLKGVVSGVIGDATLGGGASGAVGAGLLGDVAGGPIGAAVAIGAQLAIGQASKGFSDWKQAAPSFSQLVHALDLSVNSLDSFGQSILGAGSTVGMTLTQSAQAATQLTQAFTDMTPTKLSSLIKQTGQSAMYFGVTPQEMAQVSSTAATLGITSGRYASMSNGQFNQMLANGVTAGGMLGRQSSYMNGLLSIYNTVGSMNPVVDNPSAIAAQYSAMNATGIQGMQGIRGAQLMSSLDSGLANAKGLQQLLGFTAINQASGGKITDPFQMMAIMQEGAGAKVGNTTLLGAYAKVVNAMSGGNKYLAASLFPGLSINQGLAMNNPNITGAKGLSVTNKMKTPTTAMDTLNIAGSEYGVQRAGIGTLLTDAQALTGGVIENTPYGFTAGGKPYYGSTQVSPNSQVTASVFQPPSSNQSPTLGLPSLPSEVAKQQNFIAQTQSGASTASAMLNGKLPANWVIGQWALESGWGKGIGYQQDNNPGNVKPNSGYASGAGGWAKYANLAQAGQNFAQVLQEPRYKKAMEALQKGTTALNFYTLLAQAGYDGKAGEQNPTAYANSVVGSIQSVDSLVGTTQTPTVNATGTVSLSQNTIRALSTGIGSELAKHASGAKRG